MVLDNKAGFFKAVRPDAGRAYQHQDVGFFRVEDVKAEGEVAKAQLKGAEVARQVMEDVLESNGEKMYGVPIDPALEGTPLERQYLIGFWKGVAGAIKEKMNPTLDEQGFWNSIVQTIEGRVREAESAPTGEKIEMISVQERINNLVKAASDDTVRLAA